MENGEEYTTFDNLLFEKALNAFTYPYTFDKYMILEALCDVININPSCFDDTAINAITNKTAFSSKILLKLSLDVKIGIICAKGFTLEEKYEMLDKLCDIDKKELIPPLVMEPFREYYDIKELLRQDCSKFDLLENKLKKTLFYYITDDYDNDRTLLQDHSTYKKLSHFKDTFNEKNLDLLYVTLDSKNINSFLFSTEVIKENKILSNEELKCLIEKINYITEKEKISQIRSLVKSNDFSQSDFDEKLRLIDIIINENNKAKVKGWTNKFKNVRISTL